MLYTIMLVFFGVFIVLLFLCKHFGSGITQSLSVSQCFSFFLSLGEFLSLFSCANGIFRVLM